MFKFPKIAVHPLFWMFGIYFCFTGKLFLFLLMTVAAVEHECAHAFAAAKKGYALDRIVLMPYGAVIKGDVGSFSLADEIYVAMAGPLASGCTALAFVALWWFFPETYPFTDTVVFTCATLALVNFLPAYPLDGGRVFYCIFAKYFGKTRAWVACVVISMLVCAVLVALFIVSMASGNANISLLPFALFLMLGCLERKNYGSYERLRFDFTADLSRGLEERRVAVCEDLPLYKTLTFLERDKYLILDVFTKDGKYVEQLRQETLCERLATEDLQKKLKIILKMGELGQITVEK